MVVVLKIGSRQRTLWRMNAVVVSAIPDIGTLEFDEFMHELSAVLLSFGPCPIIVTWHFKFVAEK